MESNAAIPELQNAAIARRNSPVEKAKTASRQATIPTANQPFRERVNVLFMVMVIKHASKGAYNAALPRRRYVALFTGQ